MQGAHGCPGKSRGGDPHQHSCNSVRGKCVEFLAQDCQIACRSSSEQNVLHRGNNYLKGNKPSETETGEAMVSLFRSLFPLLSLSSLAPLSLSPLSLLSWSAREQSGEAQGAQASESVCFYLSVCGRARVRDARVHSVASAS